MGSVGDLLLNDGKRIPQLGFGTYKIEDDEVIYQAVIAGYRHFDCARFYKNESIVGAGLSRAINDGLVTRKELWLTTKVFPTDLTPQKVRSSLNQSLEDLQSPYVNLCLLHFPTPLKSGPGTCEVLMEDGVPVPDPSVDVREAWKALQELRFSGKCRSIGVSNFAISEIERLLAVGGVPPVVNQVECHLYLQQAQLSKDLSDTGIRIQSACPLGYRDDGRLNVPADPVIKRIAESHGVSPAQISLKWHLLQGHIPIPRTSNFERARSNRDLDSFNLSPEDLEALLPLGEKNARIVNPLYRPGGKPLFE